MIGTVGYISNGPLLDEARTERGSALRSICDRLVDMAGSELAVLMIQPPDGRDDVSNELLRRGFRVSAAGVAPATTLRLALDRPEDEIRAGLSKRLRRWTRQWERRGVTVRTATEDDLSTVARLLGETARFHGFDPFPESYLRTMYRTFASRDEVQIRLGEVSGEPVVCEVLTGCAGVVRSRLIGTDRSTRWEHLNVSAAVQWDAILWARGAGYRWFDFGGVGPESARRLASGSPLVTDGLPGPDVFKIRFGGHLHTYPQAVEWFRSPVLRATYDLGRRSERGRRVLGTVRNRLRNAVA
ncbi:GNAT family N-acetyltransferase [Pseudonocardia sp. P1]